MKHVSELQSTLSHFLDWNKARLNCLAQIIQALFVVRTVNLTQVATAFRTDAKEESSYRRVCRFFTDFSFDMSCIVLLALHLFPLSDKYLLILDRTNWKWGDSPINILMLSVAYRGISIPLFWAVLDLEGSSCLEDRIAILERVLKRFGFAKIEALLADREFVGQKWFDFLIEKKIPFLIRIKQNSQLRVEENCTVAAGQLCRWLGRKKIVNYSVSLWGCSLYISIEKKRKAKEPMIVVSNLPFESPLKIYRRRWEIETLFGCLKTRGFRMEDTHITDADKIEKLLFVLALAFCWAYRIGDIRIQEEPIPIKKHGRKARSLFREGVNLIRQAIFGDVGLRKFRRLLWCLTYSSPEAYAL
jgi:hypothetical protein